MLESAAEVNGITSLRFRRARDTNDMQDIQFNVGIACKIAGFERRCEETVIF